MAVGEKAVGGPWLWGALRPPSVGIGLVSPRVVQPMARTRFCSNAPQSWAGLGVFRDFNGIFRQDFSRRAWQGGR